MGVLAMGAACGGRTQVDDSASFVDHNQTLPRGASGATSGGQGGTGATAGKPGAPGGSGPVTVGGAGAPPSSMGGGAVGAGGSGANAGSGLGKGGAAGKGGASGKGGAAGKGGAGNGGVAGKGGATGTGGSTGTSGAGGTIGTGGSSLVGMCNPVTATGCLSNEKCVSVPEGQTTVTACEPPGKGPPVTTEGADCKRTSLGIDDNCAPGMLCTLRGVLDADTANKHTQCAKYCVQDADCADTKRCNKFTSDGYGVCIGSCVPFTACEPMSQSGAGGSAGAGAAGFGGSTGAKMSCADPFQDNTIDPATGMPAEYFGCKLDGAGVVGDGCMAPKDCGTNQFCASDPNNPGSSFGICTEWCQLADPTAMPPISEHPCSLKGQSCAATTPGEINICM